MRLSIRPRRLLSESTFLFKVQNTRSCSLHPSKTLRSLYSTPHRSFDPLLDTRPSSSSSSSPLTMAVPIAHYPRTGIKIVIVGAGFGGLACAVESRLKGHDVVVLEKSARWEQLGDIISISKPPVHIESPALLTNAHPGPNAGQVLSRWDRSLVADKIEALCMHHKHFRIHTHSGEWVLDQNKVPPSKEKPMYNGHRADFHRIIYDYALSLGVEIRLGQRIVSYHEDDTEAKAWVVNDEGVVFKGDVVVGADGVRSRARKLVLGFDDKPQSSGYAVYRAWFNAVDAGIHDDILTREFVANGDTHTGCRLPFVIYCKARTNIKNQGSVKTFTS